MQRVLDFESFSFSLNGTFIQSPQLDVLEIRYLEVSHLKPRSHCPGCIPVCPVEGKPVYRGKLGNIF